MSDYLNPFGDLPVAAPVLAPSGQVAPRLVFRTVVHEVSDLVLGEGREVPGSAPTGAED